MGRRPRDAHLERARDELFSHVIRCDVLAASMPERHDWLDDTIKYMAHRHPHLSELQLAQLDSMGRRFIRPAIPHGADTHALNRHEWQGDEAAGSQEVH